MLCSVCKTYPPKYTCPRCLIRSCSAGCIKSHKSSTGCSGERDRTGFVALSSFDESRLMQDMSFLSEAGQLAENIKVEEGTTGTHGKRKHQQTDSLPPASRRLVAAARERGTRLLLLPSSFSRHVRNRSRLRRDQSVVWTVELRQMDDSTNAALVVEAEEKETLKEIVGKTSLWKEGSVLIGQKVEGKVRSWMIESPDITLRDALNGKTLIEHPTFWMIDKNAFGNAELIDCNNQKEEREKLERDYAPPLELMERWEKQKQEEEEEVDDDDDDDDGDDSDDDDSDDSNDDVVDNVGVVIDDNDDDDEQVVRSNPETQLWG